MSQWDTRVREHPIWEELKLCGITIDNALGRETIDSEAIAGLERIRFILELIGKRLATTDSLLVPLGALNQLNSVLNRIRSELDSFVRYGELPLIVNANTYADEAIVNLNQIPGLVTPEDMATISQAASNFRTTVNRFLKNAQQNQSVLEEAIQSSTAKLESLAKTIDAEQIRLSSVISAQQSQFSSAEDSRATAFANALSEQKTSFSKDQDARNSEFSKAQLENQKTFNELVLEHTEKLKAHELELKASVDKTDLAYQKSVADLTKEYEEKAAALLIEMNQQKSAIESLVGIIGNLGVTSGYQKVADYARRMVLYWQLATVASLIGLIVVAFTAVFPLQGDSSSAAISAMIELGKDATSQTIKNTNDLTTLLKLKQDDTSQFVFIKGFVTRLFLSITFVIFATYAARQAARFFEMEQINRRRALELEALGPFIEPLEKADRDKFRVQIGERSFAVVENPAAPQEEESLHALSLLKPKELIDSIANLIKTAKGG